MKSGDKHSVISLGCEMQSLDHNFEVGPSPPSATSDPVLGLVEAWRWGRGVLSLHPCRQPCVC